jgi:outer membrane protein assembly factor BamB
MRFSATITIAMLSALSGCNRATPAPGLRDLGGVSNDDLAPGQVCSPSDPPTCSDPMTAQTCRADGSGYDYTPCQLGAPCSLGVCGCVVGTRMCQGQDAMQCDANGMFQLAEKCPQLCIGGLCDEPRCMEEMMTMGTNPHGLPAGGWPRYRHDNRNSGTTTAIVGNKPMQKWKTQIYGSNFDRGGLRQGAVVNQDNILFIAAGDADPNGMGALVSLDPMGKLIYHTLVPVGYNASTPAVRADGWAYLAAMTGDLYAIDPGGAVKWTYPSGQKADSCPVVTKDGIIIFASDDFRVYAIDANGTKLWEIDSPGEVDTALAETCDGRIIIGGKNGWFAVTAATGQVLWSVPGDAWLSSPLVAANGTVYGIDAAGTMVAIDPLGKIIWQQSVPAIGGPGVLKLGNQLFAYLGDFKIHAFDAATGKEQWTAGIGASASLHNPAPVADGLHRLYYADDGCFITAFDTNGKQLWQTFACGDPFEAAGEAELAIGDDGTIYAAENDGYLYAYQ